MAVVVFLCIVVPYFFIFISRGVLSNSLSLLVLFRSLLLSLGGPLVIVLVPKLTRAGDMCMVRVCARIETWLEQHTK